ncbi:MAG: UrcA family protein [Pseudomonadota bacterium]
MPKEMQTILAAFLAGGLLLITTNVEAADAPIVDFKFEYEMSELSDPSAGREMERRLRMEARRYCTALYGPRSSIPARTGCVRGIAVHAMRLIEGEGGS